MIVHAARRGHDEVNLVSERIDLGAVAHTPVHRHGPDARTPGEVTEHAEHLLGQLAGGDQDQALRLVPFRIHLKADGEKEGSGLPRSRSRLDHHVPAIEEKGDYLLLDGHRFFPSHPLHIFPQGGGQLFEAKTR